MPEIRNNKERIPFEHYAEEYRKTDPAEVSARTGVPYDAAGHTFTLTLMSSVYKIGHPAFSVAFVAGPGDHLSGYLPAQILVLRFLIGGNYVNSTGAFRSYREMPWGDVYLATFNNRCVKRLAYTFADRGEEMTQKMARLSGSVYEKGDIGWQFAFMPGLNIRFAVWNADDEFPPSAQILFSDNFHYAFSADDMAYIGDIFIRILSEL